MIKKTKEKRRTSTDYAIAVIFILSVTAIIYLAHMIFTEKLEKASYAAYVTPYEVSEELSKNNNEQTSYMQSENIQENNIKMKQIELDINNIIEENTKNAKKEEIIKKEIDLEYITKYTNNPELPNGMIQVIQEGSDGKQEIYIKKTYEGEKLISEKQIGSKITQAAMNKMVVIGTAPYTSNYKVKIGDSLYVTSTLVAVRTKADEKASKLISLKQNTKVKLLQKKDSWYQIQYQSYIGWAKSECFTYLEPNSGKNEESKNNKYTKGQLLNKLSFNMSLNKPSGLSLEQFKKIFSNESKDTNNVFKNNAQYFYYAEKQYGVNGVFLAAVAIHESGWGRSAIASNKNNLFGYGAYDRNPYGSAYQFSDYSEGIDLLARVFVKYYLNPTGTKIYGGNKAAGTYYNGPTLSGVNVRYATDKNWANGVYTWMKYLYNRL